MATSASVLAWRIPGTGEPGGLPSMGLHSRTQLKQLSNNNSKVDTEPLFKFPFLILACLSEMPFSDV